MTKIIISFCKIINVIFLLCISQPSYSALSHDQSLIWKSLHSEHFNIHFHNNENEIAQKTLHISEDVLTQLQDVLNWTPEHSIDIVLSDEKDFEVEGSPTFPYNLRFTLYLIAPDQFSHTDNWLAENITRQLSRLLHLDKSSELPPILPAIFGRHPLLFPNVYQPNWLKAGLAIYVETNRLNRSGIGQSNLFNMMMRMEVAKGLKSLEQINVSTSVWPAKQTHQLYGYFFYQFLDEKYGKESITTFIGNYSKNIVPFKIDDTAQLSFNKTMKELWGEFMLHTQEIFDKQTQNILNSKITDGTQITHNGYYKLHAKPIDDVNLLIAQYDGATQPEILIRNISTDSSLFVTNIEPDASVDSHANGGIVVSQVEVYRNTNEFKDLYHVDMHSKSVERLTRGERYIRTTWHPDGEQMVAVHTKLGKHTLVLLAHDGRLIDLLWEGVEGEFIGGISWSPDGLSLAASIKRNNSSWQIEEFDINKRRWKKLTYSSDVEAQPQYSKDGRSIFYSADYMGIFNIRRLDLESKNVTTLTNVLGGAFSPQPGSNDDLYYIGYTENGYDVFYLEQTDDLAADTISQNIVTESKAETRNNTKFETSEYSSLRYLVPRWWSPSLQLEANSSTKLGLYTTASDPLKRHSYDTLISVDLDSSKISGELNYRYDRLFPLVQLYLKSNNRKKYRHELYQAELLAPLISKNSKWFLGFSYATNKTYQASSSDSSKMILKNDPTMGFGIIYDSRKSHLISNSTSTGRLVTLVAETSKISNGDYGGQAIISKWQEYITIRPEHVIGFQMINGFGLDESRDFRLGGSRSDEVSRFTNFISDAPLKATLYNRRIYAFRGYKQNKATLMGRRMALYNLEWRFPIKQVGQAFEKLPVFGLDKVTGTLFTSVGSVWEEGLWPQTHSYSAGAEIRIFAELFYVVPSQIRMGYAHGFNEEGENQFYVSLVSSF